MLSDEMNERLTRVGPGTPGGEMLRRYWHPIAVASELTAETPKKRVRVLGEDLLLFRDGQGRVGLIEEQCCHRSASLFYGFIEDDGIRCTYHGWKYDCEGRCIEQPFEPAASPLKDEVGQISYPIEILSGLVFAYLGPKPAPLLPRWSALVRTDVERTIHVLHELECNWLQTMENSVDPTHTYYLHAHNMNLRNSEEAVFHDRKIKGIDFKVVNEKTWGGIIKKRVYGDVELDDNEGHPVIFPNILLLPPHPNIMMHFRLPVDDTHTQIFRCQFTPSVDGSEVIQDEITVKYTPSTKGDDGEYHLSTFGSQDAMAWETQGAITDRGREHLGTADRGIVLYRRMLREQIDAVEKGKDPVGTIRDPALNISIEIDLSPQQAEFRAQRLAARG
ncbi:MAG: aromatic ring-hydroxylating dioxygenase subunit alpha [Alphaproteobacteria bacterium]